MRVCQPPTEGLVMEFIGALGGSLILVLGSIWWIFHG